MFFHSRFKTDDLKHLSLSRLHSDSTQPVLSKQVYSPEPVLPVYETPTTLNHNRKVDKEQYGHNVLTTNWLSKPLDRNLKYYCTQLHISN